MQNEEKIQLERMDDFFNARASLYDRHMLVNLELDSFYQEIADAILPACSDFRLLDLGCGTGLELARLFEKYPGMHVTGIDVSAEMLALLRAKFPDQPMRLIEGSYFDVDFGGPFDIALTTYSLHHFPKDEKRSLYRKINAALAPGGAFVWGDYTVPSQARQDELMTECARIRQEHGVSDGGLYHLDTPFTVENEIQLLQEAGFSSTEVAHRWENASVIIAKTHTTERPEEHSMQTPSQSLTLADAIDIGLLDARQAEFFQTPGGFTGLRYAGKEYPRVAFRRALPVGQPGAYISVADAENKEIGILRDLAELGDEQLGIVAAELDRRYYCPVVLEIKSVKDKLGYVYAELRIQGSGSEGAGKSYDRNCAIKDVNKNIRMLDADRLLLFDVDGNRYLVPSLSGLDKKSLKRLEPYLF